MGLNSGVCQAVGVHIWGKECVLCCGVSMSDIQGMYVLEGTCFELSECGASMGIMGGGSCGLG